MAFDALNESRALGTVDPAAIPEFRRFFAEASCTDGARPMFPSVTAAGHAALWTGAWGHTNGASANAVQPLPWADYPLTTTLSGYDARQLRAEPLWITAARQGVPVTAHHVTQAPGPPGRWRPEGGIDSAASALDRAALARPSTAVFNGYNRRLAGPQLLTHTSHAPHPAPAWAGLPASPRPPMEISWLAGRDSLHAVFTGSTRYDAVHVSAYRRATDAVRVPLHTVEGRAAAGRDLAEHFSAPLWLPQGQARAGVHFRLWSLDADLARFELYQSHIAVAESNQPALLRAYEDAAGPFIGNSALGLLEDGAFGHTLRDGGDGTAELKYLETVELSSRQLMRGTRWLWTTRRPTLHLDYDPILDDLDHLWLGAVSPEMSGSTPELRAQVHAMRSRGWAIADQRLALYRELATTSGALLLVSGDHGMRPIWRTFAVNAVLRDAGLLAVDSAGRVRAEASDVLSPNGYFVSVNRQRYRQGRIAESRVSALLDSAEAVLRAARDPEGQPIITRIWRPQPNDSLGIGGPTGGDLYFGLAPGIGLSNRADGSPLTNLRRPVGAHGFPSVDADMQTVLCAVGPGVGGQRLPTGRLIDAAPTIADWLGLPAPAEASGRSLLPLLRTP